MITKFKIYEKNFLYYIGKYTDNIVLNNILSNILNKITSTKPKCRLYDIRFTFNIIYINVVFKAKNFSEKLNLMDKYQSIIEDIVIILIN